MKIFQVKEKKKSKNSLDKIAPALTENIKAFSDLNKSIESSKKAFIGVSESILKYKQIEFNLGRSAGKTYVYNKLREKYASKKV